jgi:T5SS/PEP-CTERM-associated repeat protein
MKHRTTKAPALRRSAVFAALALAGLLPATAAIVTLGDVTPDLSSGNATGTTVVGNGAAGSVTVNAGSTLTMERLVMGAGPNGNGSFTVSGAGSKGTVTFNTNAGNLDVGSAGSGSLSVLDGASFVYGGTGTPCQLNCRIFVSNAAGSTGMLGVTGAGSSLSTVGGIIVGQASMFTQAADGFSYGVPGGASSGSAVVLGGGSVSSSFLAVGVPGGGNARTGTESATGTVLLDGIGSVWNLVRNGAQTAGRALLSVGTVSNSGGTSFGNTSGIVAIQNGAVMTLDGSSAPGEFSGVNIAAPAVGTVTSNVTGDLTVVGAGSRLQMQGGIGFLNIGRGVGTQATLTVADGGVITGNGTETGLIYMTVGNSGSTGSATISGSGSLVRLNGRNSATNSDPAAVLNSGAFLSVGRGGGNGSLSISNGGRLEIDTSALALTNPDGQTGLYVGAFSGATGSLSVSGPGSTLLVSSGSGMTPYAAIGRDSGNGSLLISNGGVVEISSTHMSVPNPGSNLYLPGDLNSFEIGRSLSGAPTSGSVTVTGAGSKLLLSGNADAFIQVGQGAGGMGTLTIANGGQTRSSALFIGTASGSGVLNMNAGTVVIDGMLNGGPAAGFGGGLGVGRGGGTGVANISNGSTVTITSSADRASMGIGGSSTAPGGTGSVNLSGGSTLTVQSPNALVGVGAAGSSTQAGIGNLTLSGAGTSFAAVGSGARVLLGAGSNTIGTVTVGAGAALSSEGLIGVAHDGSASTAGIGTLVVNGTATAAQLMIGQNGLLAGNGVVNANVTNQGTIGPGMSPGKLTINGAFDNSGGKIVLEVQSLGNGQYALDELVFADWSQVVLGDGAIEFVFLGDTDPTAFQDAGLFGLGSFFRQLDGNGNEAPLDGSLLALFADASFSASAAQFAISSLGFDPLTGAFNATVATVPLPAPVLLTLLGLGLLAAQRRRQPRR